MDATPFSQWRNWVRDGYRHLPVAVRTAYPAGTPKMWSAFLSGDTYAVLESGKDGRFTYAASGCAEQLVGGRTAAELYRPLEASGRYNVVSMTVRLPDVLRNWLTNYRAPRLPDWPPFCGGIVGYLGYEYGSPFRYDEREDLGLPVYVWNRVDEVVVFDSERGELFAVVHQAIEGEDVRDEWRLADLYNKTADRARALADRWRRACERAEDDAVRRRIDRIAADFRTEELHFEVERLPGLRTAFPKNDFLRAVVKIQDYIRSGDTYQVNLSVRQQRPLAVPPAIVYEMLRRINPSPYMAHLQIEPGFNLVCGSPELLVRLVDRKLEARPIAGTRRRGADDGEDGAMERELRATEKELAEHVMLVDLVRNDLGRVAKYGSVCVSELMTVERYSHVMHLVSHVVAELREGFDAVDVIHAMFPGGTVTGAPKKRTMQIIAELEPVNRGPYTGSIGWIDYSGNMELNITIRTMLALEGTAYVQAGAGIVLDSVPEREYRECLNKARALWKALEYAERFACGDR